MQKKHLLLLVIILLSSCSIEKRHYTKGYSVNWFSHKSNNDNKYSRSASKPIEELKTKANEDYLTASTKNKPADKASETPLIIEPTAIAVRKTKLPIKLQRLLPNSFETKIYPDTLAQKIQSKRRVSAIALISFVSSLLGIVGVIIAITAGIITGLSLLLLVGLVVGSIAIHKIKKHPEKYRGRNFAIWGIVLSILGLLFVCLILVTLLFLGLI